MRIKIGIVFLAIFCCVATAKAEQWHKGGTLHKASVSQYLAGSERDQLATAFDWIAVAVSDAAAKGLSAETIHDGCVAVRECIKTAASGIEAVQNSLAAEIAIMCMAQVKNDYPWMLTKKW